MRNLKPMPMVSTGRWRKWGGIFTTVRLLVLVLGIAGCYFLLLEPFYGKIQMAEKILCSGDQDFIYSVHPSTQVVQATRSSRADGLNLSDTQLAVLELAHPNLTGWRHDLAAYYSSGNFHVITFPDPSAFRNKSLFDVHAFRRIIATVQDDVLQGSMTLSCQDWDRVEDLVGMDVSARRIISATHGRHSNCSGVDMMCADMNSNTVRALCPLTCGCSNVKNPAAGFFASPSWGCPQKCYNRLKASMGLFASIGVSDPCRDVTPSEFSTSDPLKNYIRGFYAYFLSLMESGGISISMKIELSDLEDNFNIPSSQLDFLYNHILNSSFLHDITQGYWQFAPGIPHPRGLTGCQFWTSWEAVLVFGTDLCATSSFRSLRMFCPESCSCKARDDECPMSCPVR